MIGLDHPYEASLYQVLMKLTAFSIAPVDPAPVGKTTYYPSVELKLLSRLSLEYFIKSVEYSPK